MTETAAKAQREIIIEHELAESLDPIEDNRGGCERTVARLQKVWSRRRFLSRVAVSALIENEAELKLTGELDPTVASGMARESFFVKLRLHWLRCLRAFQGMFIGFVSASPTRLLVPKQYFGATPSITGDSSWSLRTGRIEALQRRRRRCGTLSA